MPTLRPTSDVSNTGWVTAPLWSKVSDQSNATYIEPTGAGFKFAYLGLADLPAEINDTDQRIIRLRVQALVSGSVNTARTFKLNPYLGSDVLVGAQIDRPGTRPYSGNWYSSGWLYERPDGQRFTVADLNAMQLRLYSGGDSGTLSVHEVLLNYDYRNRAKVGVTSPATVDSWDDAQVMPLLGAAYQWSFDATNSNGARFSQLAFHAKVFERSVVEGGGFDPDTSPAVWDSGIVGSPVPEVNLDRREGGGVFPRLQPGSDYYFVVRAAQDYYGEQWWSEWSLPARFVTSSAPEVYLNPPDTLSSAPTISWTYIQSEGYEMAGIELLIVPDNGKTLQENQESGDVLYEFSGDYTSPTWQYEIAPSEGLPSMAMLVYLRARESRSGMWSNWSSVGWDISHLPALATPAVSLSSNLQDACIEIDASFEDVSSAGADLLVANRFMLERRMPGGSWDVVRGFGDGSSAIESTHAVMTGDDGQGAYTGVMDQPVLFDPLGNPRRLMVDISLPTWTPGGTEEILLLRGQIFSASPSYNLWYLALLPDGKLRWTWRSADLTATRNLDSTASLPLAPGRAQVAVLFNYKDGADQSATFHYSTDEGETWSQLGSPVVSAGNGGDWFFPSPQARVGDEDGSRHVVGDLFGFLIDEPATGARKAEAGFSGHKLGERSWKNQFGVEVSLTDTTPLSMSTETVDCEVPFNQDAEYRARLVGTKISNGERRWGGYDSVSTERLDINDKVWIKSPLDRELAGSWPISGTWMERTHYVERGVLRPISQMLPVVGKGNQSGESFQLGFTVVGEERISDLLELLQSGKTMLVQIPSGRQWYVEVAGEFTARDYLWDDRFGYPDEVEQVTVPFIEVRRP